MRLAELEQESLATRRVLERVPQAHLSWKPHPRSMDTIPELPVFVQQEARHVDDLSLTEADGS